jgi:hypothetical protein
MRLSLALLMASAATATATATANVVPHCVGECQKGPPESSRAHVRLHEEQWAGMREAGVLPDPSTRATKQTGVIPCDEATGMAGEYPCKKIDLMGYVSLYDLGTDPDNAGRFGGASDIWG